MTITQPELRFDLHCHSHCSDGKLSPSDLVARARVAGVTHLALTDHDTCAGVAEAQAACLAGDIEVIPGIEISCRWATRDIHVVGLAVDADHPKLSALIDQLAVMRTERAEAIALRLAKLGVPDALAKARQVTGASQVGRLHFAQLLLEIGKVKSINQAFKRYLGAGKPAYVNFQWPDMSPVIATIIAAGGVAVLAHPLKYGLTRTKLRELTAAFVDAGGGAIEVVSGNSQANVDTQMLASLAIKHGVYASVGSDFHAPGMPWQALGKTTPLPDTVAPVWQCWQ